MNTQKHLF